MTGVAVCSLSLTWISTVLRFYVRLGILKFVGREDWLTIAAMVCIQRMGIPRYSANRIADHLYHAVRIVFT